MQNFGDQHFQSWIIVVLDCSDAIIVGRRFPREIEIRKKCYTEKRRAKKRCTLIIFRSVRSPRMIDNRWFVRPSDEGWNDKIELCPVTVIGTENGTRPRLASAATPWGRNLRHKVSSFELCLDWIFFCEKCSLWMWVIGWETNLACYPIRGLKLQQLRGLARKRC